MAEETILLIDIDEAAEQDIVSTLEAEGYLVFTASGREMAVRMARKVKPALICINPAPSGGLEICRELRDETLMKSVPIIITTSYSGSMDPRYTARYGIVDFLKIPVGSSELLEKVERFIIEGIPEQPAPHGDLAEAEDEAWDIAGGSAVEPAEVSVAEEIPEDMLPEEVFPVEEDREPVSPAVPELRHEAFMRRKPSPARRGARKAGRRTSWPLLALVLVLVTAAGIGLGMYGFRYFRQGPPVTQSPVVRPVPPGQPAGEDAVPLQEESRPVSSQTQQPEPQAPAEVTGIAAGMPQQTLKAYSIQAGAFKSEPNAETLAGQLREKGYEAFVRRGTTKDHGTIFRVLIGQYGGRKDAAAAASEIESSAGVKATIYRE